MAKILLIDLKVFSHKPRMYLIDEEKVIPLRVSETELIQNQVLNFLNTEEIQRVYLEGQKDFIIKYANDISHIIATKYTKNKNMEVYVNGKIFNS